MKKNTTISSILIGDTLGDLVKRLDIGDGEARMIVIVMGDNMVRVAKTDNINKAEQIGILYMAIDRLALDGRE